MQELEQFLLENIKNSSVSVSEVKIFATGIFRKLTEGQMSKIKVRLFENVGVDFEVISHELENFYLEKAISVTDYDKEYAVLNIGGKTTEIVYFNHGITSKKINIDIGVGSILKAFPDINMDVTKEYAKEIKDFVLKKLPENSEKSNFAIYTGGELNYMELASYNLQDNSLFNHSDLRKLITFQDFKYRNSEVVHNTTLEELQSFMPENPQWMNGARACSLLAQTIFEKYGINNIVPSDANLLSGVTKQQFSKVVICGSMRKHLDDINELMNFLKNKNIDILSPKCIKNPKLFNGEFVVFSGQEISKPEESFKIELEHIKAIEEADAVLFCNPDGYIGHSTITEIGACIAFNKRIVFTNSKDIDFDLCFPKEIGLLA
nr:hypothetical protein [Enterococcus larvae]